MTAILVCRLLPFRDILTAMCNRIMQNKRRVKPGEPLVYFMRHPEGTLELGQGIFSGSARDDNPGAWRHGRKVLVPHVSAFGNRDDDTGEEHWESLPPDSALEAYVLPPRQRRDGSGTVYRLLKFITCQGTAEQAEHFERGRIPTAVHCSDAPAIPDLPTTPEKPPRNTGTTGHRQPPKPGWEQLELFDTSSGSRNRKR